MKSRRLQPGTEPAHFPDEGFLVTPASTLAPAPAASGRTQDAEYPFASRWAALSDGRLHYVDEGTGEAILFVHGTPTWSYEWRHLITALSATHRCIAPDHLGFGFSDRPAGADYTPEAHARRLAEFVRALGLAKVTLVVHDFGGPIALALAIERPELVARIVVINSWMWSFANDAEMARKGRIAGTLLGRFLYRRFNMSLRGLMPYAYGDRRRLTPAIHRVYLDRFPDAESRGLVLWALAKALLGSSAFYQSLWDRRERLRGMPALIVWGMKDRAFEPRLLERWRDALPQARIVELGDSGHWPHEEEPESVLRAVQAFVGGEP